MASAAEAEMAALFITAKKYDTIVPHTHRNGMATASNTHSNGQFNSSGNHKQNNSQQSNQIIRHETVVAQGQIIPGTIQVLLGAWIIK